MQVLELIACTPALAVLEVTAALTPLSAALAAHVEPCEGSYNIECYGTDETAGVTLPQWVNIHYLPHFKAPFRGTARQFEFVILNEMLDKHHFPQKILELCYRTLENSGEIILIQNKATMPLEKITDALEACEFRAVNSIELLEDAYVVSAKKMHMWGNGL